MILEVAILDVKPGQEASFERDFATAAKIIAKAKGCHSHELRHCVERPNRYLLLAHWDSLASHLEGFRRSAEYQEWKQLLHHYYEPFPTVEHYTEIPPLSGSR